MAQKPLRPCRRPGCPELTRDGGNASGLQVDSLEKTAGPSAAPGQVFVPGERPIWPYCSSNNGASCLASDAIPRVCVV